MCKGRINWKRNRPIWIQSKLKFIFILDQWCDSDQNCFKWNRKNIYFLKSLSLPRFSFKIQKIDICITVCLCRIGYKLNTRIFSWKSLDTFRIWLKMLLISYFPTPWYINLIVWHYKYFKHKRKLKQTVHQKMLFVKSRETKRDLPNLTGEGNPVPSSFPSLSRSKVKHYSYFVECITKSSFVIDAFAFKHILSRHNLQMNNAVEVRDKYSGTVQRTKVFNLREILRLSRISNGRPHVASFRPASTR